jgi:hypothetical protein
MPTQQAWHYLCVGQVLQFYLSVPHDYARDAGSPIRGITHLTLKPSCTFATP